MIRVLLVDDDDSLRKMLKLSLQKMGHLVEEAGTGTEALRLCECEPPDVVVTDIIMPDKEGLETIVTIRQLYPELRIIAMSGGGRTNTIDYLKIARRLGAMHTLEKPFSYETLSSAITKVMAEPVPPNVRA